METHTSYTEAYFPPKSREVRCGMCRFARNKEFALSCSFMKCAGKTNVSLNQTHISSTEVYDLFT